MSRSNDAGHFFQTSDALATTKRKAAKAKNKYGNPIKLPSKILAAHIDPYSTSAIFVAEAAGEVKRVNLESGTIDRIFTQGNAPLTCLALCPQPRILFAGSWDKTIYAISLDDPPSAEVRKFQSHTDFIKCLHVTILNSQPVLLSGSADKSIILWDIFTGKPLQKIKTHSQALQVLTLDPETLIPADDSNNNNNNNNSSNNNVDDDDDHHQVPTLFTATSSPELRRFALHSLTSTTEISPDSPILAHDTSVYALAWDSSGDLWTASADKSAKRLVRARGWEADTVLTHGDFVRDVVVFDSLGVVVTACRDEDVRVWDAGSGELKCAYGGHFDEVTGLVKLGDGRSVASVSIDGTVRRWGLEKGAMEEYLRMVEREVGGQGEEAREESGGLLTAEEEAELAELMDDDDDDD